MKSCPLQPIRLRFLFLKVALKNELEFHWLLKAPPLVCCTGFEVALPLCLFKWVFQSREIAFCSRVHLQGCTYRSEWRELHMHGHLSVLRGFSRILQNVISSHENTPLNRMSCAQTTVPPLKPCSLTYDCGPILPNQWWSPGAIGPRY